MAFGCGDSVTGAPNETGLQGVNKHLRPVALYGAEDALKSPYMQRIEGIGTGVKNSRRFNPTMTPLAGREFR